jgi:hypothetical protein
MDVLKGGSAPIPRLLLALTSLYFFASLWHFAHNAEFICEYPNLPAWLTSAQVYAAWGAVTATGLLGLLLTGGGFQLTGLASLAGYAALGFDGLGHYARAPFAFHTVGANVTILSEVFAAALLMGAVGFLLAKRLFSNRQFGF